MYTQIVEEITNYDDTELCTYTFKDKVLYYYDHPHEFYKLLWESIRSFSWKL